MVSWTYDEVKNVWMPYYWQSSLDHIKYSHSNNRSTRRALLRVARKHRNEYWKMKRWIEQLEKYNHE